MSARQGLGQYDSVARKWLALAERRKLHIVDMYDSGRWRRYYTEAQLLEEMRNAIWACEEWARLIGDRPHAKPQAEPDAEVHFELQAAE